MKLPNLLKGNLLLYIKIILALLIETLEGDMYAEVGDYIIQGVHGEYYSCKPNIFTETYEEIENG